MNFALQFVYRGAHEDRHNSAISNNLTCDLLRRHADHGTVNDTSGAPIPDAIVVFRWYSAAREVSLSSKAGFRKDVVIKTGENGGFAADLPDGFYDVFVSSMAFTPMCRKIRIGLSPPKSLLFHMGADPVVTEELGMKVEATAPGRN